MSQSQNSSVLPSVLVIVTGQPGTGKTYLSHYLSEMLKLPLLNRDTFKETLFDSLGSSDRAWSKRLGSASYQLLYAMLTQLLRVGCSCIIESNFDDHYDTSQLRQLQQHYPYRPFQIACSTEPSILLQRLQHRVASGERHPGHVDHLEIAGLTHTRLTGSATPLALDGELVNLDTTDFTAINYSELVAQIQRFRNQPV